MIELVKYKFIAKVILRPAISRSVFPGIRPPSGTRDQFLFIFHGIDLLTFAQFFFHYGAPFLVRGQVCRFSVRN
jgi:hypothetical protein